MTQKTKMNMGVSANIYIFCISRPGAMASVEDLVLDGCFFISQKQEEKHNEKTGNERKYRRKTVIKY